MPHRWKSKRRGTSRRAEPRRGMWRRSTCLALVMHAGISLAMLHYAGFGLDDVTVGAWEPVVHGALVEVEADLNLPIQSPQPDATPPAVGQARVAIEPSMTIIRDVVSAALEDREKPARPDAMEELVRKAVLLERISSPQAVASMSAKIRLALGTRDEIMPRPADGEPVVVDIDTCQLLDVVRVESDGVVEIRETLTDPAGYSITIVSIRRIDAVTREATYEQVLIEPGRAPQRVQSDKEAFEEAMARYRPFKLMHRFPLIQQLHRQAVVPILDKLSNEGARAAQPTKETPK